MNNLNIREDILLNVFAGSLQQLHIFPSLAEFVASFERTEVTDDRDHSFVYFEKDCAYVRWKNKAGEIQVCGSGAYAVAYFFLTHTEYSQVSLVSKYIELAALRTKNDKVSLSLPIRIPVPCDPIGDHEAFMDSDSGIFFVRLESERDLIDFNFHTFKKFLDPLEEIHGLCMFFWNEAEAFGSVRYFCPWHGRDEDSVTGSIHMYLTPLIQKLFGVDQQRWTQLSKNGGELQSMIIENSVILQGMVFLERINMAAAALKAKAKQ